MYYINVIYYINIKHYINVIYYTMLIYCITIILTVFKVFIHVRTSDGTGFLSGLNICFYCGTGIIMTECSS